MAFMYRFSPFLRLCVVVNGEAQLARNKNCPLLSEVCLNIPTLAPQPTNARTTVKRLNSLTGTLVPEQCHPEPNARKYPPSPQNQPPKSSRGSFLLDSSASKPSSDSHLEILPRIEGVGGLKHYCCILEGKLSLGNIGHRVQIKHICLPVHLSAVHSCIQCERTFHRKASLWRSLER